MAQRLRLFDIRVSRIPPLLGLCKDDVPRICDFVNAAQSRLLNAKEAGDESWWGTWAEIAFNVSRDQPYITLPREIARLESVNVCDHPRPVRNSFYEYLQFGNGRLPKHYSTCNPCRQVQVLSRNNAATFVNLTGTPRVIAVYATQAQDIGKRILIQGADNNNQTVYSQDTFQRVQGIFVTLATPFAIAPMQFNAITGIQKDVTAGPVQVFEIDPTTATQTLLLVMEPTETTAWYRRYYLDSLPISCCPSVPSGASACTTPASQPVQVTAIAKLDLIPVVADTDYCLIQNMEAILHECQAVRYSGIDTTSAKNFEKYHHGEAIDLLNGELSHYLGKNQVAINLSVFGSASLERQRIGTLI